MTAKYSGILIKVAWRNVWRNKVRSAVVVLAVGMGLWAGIFTASFMYGISTQRLNNIVNAQLSHIQLHHPAFTEDMDPALQLANGDSILNALAQNDQVKSVCGRTLASGMAASSHGNGGVIIKGVNPAKEIQVTNVYEKITEGSFFDEGRKKQIVIGEKLAIKLKAKLKRKINLTVQNLQGDFVTESFVVTGIYKTNSSKYDEANVFVQNTVLADILGTDGNPHEIALLLKDAQFVDSTKNMLQKKYPAISVQSWKDLAPELDYINEIMDEYLRIFMIIILLAMAFGIINTMLMAVMERTREIGVLMAIGMNKARIFFMIMLETVFLTLTGVPVGLLLSMATIRYLGKTGVDLSLFSKGLANFDVETIVYPTLDMSFYPVIILMAATTAVLAAIYPAYKAIRLRPSGAIRAV